MEEPIACWVYLKLLHEQKELSRRSGRYVLMLGFQFPMCRSNIYLADLYEEWLPLCSYMPYYRIEDRVCTHSYQSLSLNLFYVVISVKLPILRTMRDIWPQFHSFVTVNNVVRTRNKIHFTRKYTLEFWYCQDWPRAQFSWFQLMSAVCSPSYRNG